MAAFDYTITTDAFSFGGQSFGAETLDFTLPYTANHTYPISLTFQGSSLDAATVHLVAANEVFLILNGPEASLQTPWLPLPTVTGQTTMGFDDSFVAVIPEGSGFITGKITATGISLPEPSTLLLLLAPAVYIVHQCLKRRSQVLRAALTPHGT